MTCLECQKLKRLTSWVEREQKAGKGQHRSSATCAWERLNEPESGVTFRKECLNHPYTPFPWLVGKSRPSSSRCGPRQYNTNAHRCQRHKSGQICSSGWCWLVVWSRKNTKPDEYLFDNGLLNNWVTEYPIPDKNKKSSISINYSFEAISKRWKQDHSIAIHRLMRAIPKREPLRTLP